MLSIINNTVVDDVASGLLDSHHPRGWSAVDYAPRTPSYSHDTSSSVVLCCQPVAVTVQQHLAMLGVSAAAPLLLLCVPRLRLYVLAVNTHA
jgi:hypothetical protein